MTDMTLKFKSFFSTRLSGSEKRGDAGLSIPEVLISIGLSGLLALGCAQLALASFASAKYTQTVAVKSLSSGNINRLITSDMEKATGFLDSSGVAATHNPIECSLASSGNGPIRPLLTLFHADGSSTGYEVRNSGNSGALWRVNCPTPGVANGPSQILASYLPNSSDATWDTSIMCVNFPAGGNITAFSCSKDILLNSMALNPGIIFTVPATNSFATVPQPEQKIVAARNVG
jgi:hypothetical protein